MVPSRLGPASDVARTCAGIVLAIGATVLVGWALDIPVLRSLLPGYIGMKANTAIALMAFAMAILLLPRARASSLGLAAFCALIGLATLGQYLFGWDLGIDELLFVDITVSSGHPPGRLAPITAVSLAGLGLSFVVVHATRRWHRTGQLVLVMTALVSFQALVSYLLGMQHAFGLAAHTRVALHTAASLILLSVATLVSFGKHGFMTVLLADGLAGRTARTLVGAAVVGPPCIHFAQLLGQNMGLYDADFGTLLRVVGSALFFVVMVWRSSESILRAEAALETEAASRARLESALAVSAVIEQNEARLRTLFDSAFDGIISLAANGTITQWNPRAAAMFGWSLDEARGKDLRALVLSVDGSDVHAQLLDSARGGGAPRAVEMTAVRRSGETFALQISVSAIRVGDEVGYTAFVADISERKRNELELIQTRQAALDAARIKADFLANMSHEIRTPLNGIIGMSGLLAETTLGEAQRKYVRIVQSSGAHLLTIINDILDLSKIEAGKLELEALDFSVPSMIEAQVEMVRPMASSKGLTLITQMGPGIPHVSGDPGRLGQVMLNLLGNAIKFTSAGVITVRVDTVSTDWDRVELRFSVSDTGVGIAQETRERLFQPFIQADGSTARRFGGTGLGLSICKRLVEMMGGTIGVESALGQGSTFWFTCALGRASVPVEVEPPAPPPRVPSLAAMKGARILVADDNAVNQLLILTLLKQMGYVAQAVGNGHEAVETLSGGAFDLVLMDCQMPEMDGFEATRQIRRSEGRGGGDRIPIIALTANVMEEDVKRCLEAGMDGHLAKPIRKQVLAQTIRSALLRREPNAVAVIAADHPGPARVDRSGAARASLL